MKHLKKNLALSFIMVVLTIISSGCSKDENSEDGLKSLVGTWVYKKQMSSFSVEYKYVFRDNNTYSWYAGNAESEKGTYTLNDNTITLVPDNDYHASSKLIFTPDGSMPNIYDPDNDWEYTRQG